MDSAKEFESSCNAHKPFLEHRPLQEDTVTSEDTLNCSICFEFLEAACVVESAVDSENHVDGSTTDSSFAYGKVDKGIISLQCGHKFHLRCAESWLEKQHTCPNCRKRVSSPERPQTAPDSRYMSLSLVNNENTGHWSERNRENSVMVTQLDNGMFHLDFTRCPTANDNFIKPYILRYKEKIERVDAPNSPITKMTVKTIYRNCPALKWLDVSHCSSLDKRAITKLVDRCSGLRHLGLAYIRNITDSCVHQIGGAPYGSTRGLRELQYLDLTDCNRVSDKGLEALAACKKLTSLRIAYCTKVTDNGMSKLLPTLHMLKRLNVRGDKYLTSQFVRSLLINAPFLERVDMVSCPMIDGRVAASQLVRQKLSLDELLCTEMILSGPGVEGLRSRLVN